MSLCVPMNLPASAASQSYRYLNAHEVLCDNHHHDAKSTRVIAMCRTQLPADESLTQSVAHHLPSGGMVAQARISLLAWLASQVPCWLVASPRHQDSPSSPSTPCLRRTYRRDKKYFGCRCDWQSQTAFQMKHSKDLALKVCCLPWMFLTHQHYHIRSVM